jgi:hypothetical protein
MITRSRLARISSLTLTLGIVVAGLALAQREPMTADRLPERNCAPAMSLAKPQPDLDPIGLMPPKPSPKSCYYGFYDEFWKDGEVCRWRNSCDGYQYHGTCPNGYDYHTTETVICYCF